MNSVSGSGAITTPPACVPTLRASPSSRLREIDEPADLLFLLDRRARSSSSSASALSSVMPISNGISFAMRST